MPIKGMHRPTCHAARRGGPKLLGLLHPLVRLHVLPLRVICKSSVPVSLSSQALLVYDDGYE